jgi:hypothetical protein
MDRKEKKLSDQLLLAMQDITVTPLLMRRLLSTVNDDSIAPDQNTETNTIAEPSHSTSSFPVTLTSLARPQETPAVAESGRAYETEALTDSSI